MIAKREWFWSFSVIHSSRLDTAREKERRPAFCGTEETDECEIGAWEGRYCPLYLQLQKKPHEEGRKEGKKRSDIGGSNTFLPTCRFLQVEC